MMGLDRRIFFELAGRGGVTSLTTLHEASVNYFKPVKSPFGAFALA